jgi:nucleotide-binding universal stress UspA family protein
MYKTIIVHVDESPLLDARLRASAWLAYAMLTGSMAVTPVGEFDALRNTARASLARFAERARQLDVASVEERMVEDENRDALLLQARYADLVVTGQDAGDAATVRGLPQYLAMHGVRVEVLVERTGAAVGDALLGVARACGAGLLVTGAAGHSHYREIVLGGVTRLLLDRAPLPVLFAH